MDTGTQIVREERQDSGFTRPVIEHNDSVNFVVNILSLHNSQVIRRLVSQNSGFIDRPLIPPSQYPTIRQNAVISLVGHDLAESRNDDKSAPGSDNDEGMYSLPYIVPILSHDMCFHAQQYLVTVYNHNLTHFDKVALARLEEKPLKNRKNKVSSNQTISITLN
jgi:hypothetical protein